MVFSAAVSDKVRRFLRATAGPVLVFALTATTYVLVAGNRTEGPSPDNHFAHLAHSWRHGELGVMGDRPPGANDWACFDPATEGPCPPNAIYRPNVEGYRWHVSFPPFPAVLLLPAVYLYDVDFSDVFFWAVFAGLAPALLLLLLRRLRREGLSERRAGENYILVVLFAFGSVYFFSAVQGSVWFAAHVVASACLCGFLLWGLGAKRPLLAGVMLGACFLTRPSTAPWALFFLFEAIRSCKARGLGTLAPLAAHWDEILEEWAEASRAPQWVRGLRTPIWFLGAFFVSIQRRITRSSYGLVATVRWRSVALKVLVFSIPVLIAGGFAMWNNNARFGDPFEFGHEFLQDRWRARVETWGLFSYHYLGRNLAVFLASTPWIHDHYPYVTISLHGLALWVTTPNLLWAVWPGRRHPLIAELAFVAALVALLDLCYYNTGWVQFGHRFALDYFPALIVILAMSRRKFSTGFLLALVVAIAINAFGAITFNRVPLFYDDDRTQLRYFEQD